MKIRVYYEDTDCGDVVYHSNYIKFCERARSELFFANGLSPHKQDSFFVVTKIEANFLGSAKLGDMLDIQTKVIEYKKVSISLEQNILKNDIIIYTQKIKLAYLKNGNISKIPKDEIDILLGKNDAKSL